MKIITSPKLIKNVPLTALLPLAFFSVGIFVFTYKFQNLPQTSRDPQMISEPKNKKEIVLEKPKVTGDTIVWGEPEVWRYNAEDTKDWKTYTSPNLGISFKYPPKDWYPKDFNQNNNFIIDVTAPVATPSVGNFYEGQELSLLIVPVGEEFVDDVNSIEQWEVAALEKYQEGYYLFNSDGKVTKLSLITGEGIKGYVIRKDSQKYFNAHFTLKNGTYAMSVQVYSNLSQKDFDKYVEFAKEIAFTLN